MHGSCLARFTTIFLALCTSPSLEDYKALPLKSDSNLNLFEPNPPTHPQKKSKFPFIFTYDPNLNCSISPSLQEALHFTSDSNLILFICIPQNQSILNLESHSSLNLTPKSCTFVWVSTHPATTTKTKQLGDPTGQQVPSKLTFLGYWCFLNIFAYLMFDFKTNFNKYSWCKWIDNFD